MSMDTMRPGSQWDGAYKQYGVKPIPFKKGEPFNVEFRVQKDHFQVTLSLFTDNATCFKVFVDGKEFFEKYDFRLPLSSISHFGVDGYGLISFVQLGDKYDVG